MKKSILLSGVFTAALALAPFAGQNADAQSWPVFNSKNPASNMQVDNRGVMTLAPVLERVTPAVVDITVSGTQKARPNPFEGDEFFERFFGERGPSGRGLGDRDNEREVRSAGSGVIIDAGKGYIVTNHHVVKDADKITITLTDRRTAEAELVGSDAATDIALLKIDLSNLTALKLADSDQVKVGDYTIAVGNAFGIGQTVTSGIVSALGRSTYTQDSYQDFIQTDAAINKGNSGGALVNSKGELIGINAQILSRSGGSNGIGFAIPTNMITGLMDQLVSYGEVRRGRIGVTIQNITPDLMDAMNIKTRDGALVSSVAEDSPAEKAGIKPGDIITGFNGRTIIDSSDIRNAVGYVELGKKAKITYIRDGKTYSSRIGVEGFDDDENISEETAVDEDTDTASFDAFNGASFGNIPADLDPPGGDSGVLVTNVKRRSKAAEAGLRKGDIIRAVNNMQIEDLDDFEDAVEGRKKAVALTVQRGRARIYIAVK